MTVFYVGVTNGLERQITKHRENRGLSETFAGKYFCYKLVYWERHPDINHAIEREKEIKLMSSKEKEALIKLLNPKMNFLNIY